ncbi:Uncharacterised protein [Enterobacter hormaechei]|nr:Uncharacterised protein [Enterobacter hormaechei]
MAFHTFDTNTVRLLHQFIQTFYLSLCFFKMLLKCCHKLFIRLSTGHLWQGANNLLFSTVNIREIVNKKIFKRFNTHNLFELTIKIQAKG